MTKRKKRAGSPNNNEQPKLKQSKLVLSVTPQPTEPLLETFTTQYSFSILDSETDCAEEINISTSVPKNSANLNVSEDSLLEFRATKGSPSSETKFFANLCSEMADQSFLTTQTLQLILTKENLLTEQLDKLQLPFECSECEKRFSQSGHLQ
uniref:Uncharacterized protein n=1 Tax=Sphaerodactylus townsendi TaxID=933632 RepID=A0ACB8EFD7_9SAUR